MFGSFVRVDAWFARVLVKLGKDYEGRNGKVKWAGDSCGKGFKEKL